MLIEIAVAALAGGFLCLDRVFLELMISRPLVAGTVTGLILFDPYTGLVTGALIELLWIDRAPVGTVVPPNDSIAAVVAAAAVIISGKALGAVSRELIALGILLLLPSAFLGQAMDTWIIRRNDELSRKAVTAASTGDFRGVSRMHMRALVQCYLANTAFILAGLGIGITAILNIYPHMPAAFQKGLFYIYLFLPVLGVSVALNTIHLRGMIPVFSGVFLLMTIVFESVM